ncbi:DUF294 nucleotidyltransferase-like domain-containing protein [Aegicerativicinus sediminis]
MKNTIAQRIADFLKDFPPFDRLTPTQNLFIAQNITVKYLDKNSLIFDAKTPLQPHFYVINKGAVLLHTEINGVDKQLNKYDEGDIFGLRAIFAKESYSMTAIAEEDTILYCIPIEIFRPLAENNRAVGQFLIESFASNTEFPFSTTQQETLFGNATGQIEMSEELFELQPTDYIKKVVTASPDMEIRKVAEKMTEKNIGSIVIAEKGLPIGIITDKDLRNNVATGKFGIDAPAKDVMSSPVLCYTKSISIAQAQLSMMKHQVGHLCITEDGTPNTKLIGIVAQNDIIVKKGSNPTILMKAISRTNSTKELRRIRKKTMLLLKGYINQNIPMTLITRIMFELNDATIKHVIKRCLKKMDSPPPVPFAWISLGSQGRKEQLLHTDQDNAIIFQNVPDETIDEVRSYFLKLAKKVNKRLDIIGFDFCPGDMMAKNPNWCLSLDEWKHQFTKWTTDTGNDEILLCSIFFDFDITYGDATLTSKLADHIFEITRNNQIFLSKLAASALRSPSPFGFFRQFLVEQDGEYKDHFDLKKRGLMPITDAGRVLAISYRLKNINNTAERFEELARIVPENEELFLSCSYTSKALLKFRTKHGLINNDSGRFIELETLTKEEKMKLKRCFKTIGNVQELIKVKFNVQNF